MKVNAPKIITYTITSIIMFAFLLMAIAFLSPVDVLKNWSLTIEDKEYKMGSVAIVTTKFEKVRNVTGISKRYIVCNTPSGASTRIPVSEGDANRGISKDSNELYLVIPRTVPSVPTRCHFNIVIEYTIYSFRKHVEVNDSNEFTVIQGDEEGEIPITQNSEDDNLVVEGSPRSNGRASETPLPAQRTFNPQPNPPAEPTPEPSPVVPPNDAVICQLGPITGIINPILGIC